MALYDKRDDLLSYFSNVEKTEFQKLVRTKESFGSTFLHSAAGRNNVEFLQNVFEEVCIPQACIMRGGDENLYT